MENNFDRFCLGTAQFSGKYGITRSTDIINDSEIEDIFNFYTKKGGIYIDTAENYGSSLERISPFILPQHKIISKVEVAGRKDFNLIKSVENILGLLKINKLDSLLLHNSKDFVSMISNQEIGLLKKENFCNFVGVSVYDYHELNITDRYGMRLLDCVDVIQAPLNLFNSKFICSPIYNEINEKNIRIDFRSIFLQGILLVDDFSNLNKLLGYKKYLRQWINFSKKYDKTALCLSFVIKHMKNKDKILIGVNKLEELKQVLNSLSNIDFNFPQFNSDKFPDELIDPRKWS